MHAACPTSPQGHTTFITTAHVMEEWKVAADGTFIETLSTLETTHSPDPGNVWECAKCGAQATVT